MHESLASYLAGNAVFLAERLVACRESAENLALLGRCYYRAGQTAPAGHGERWAESTQYEPAGQASD